MLPVEPARDAHSDIGRTGHGTSAYPARAVVGGGCRRHAHSGPLRSHGLHVDAHRRLRPGPLAEPSVAAVDPSGYTHRSCRQWPAMVSGCLGRRRVTSWWWAARTDMQLTLTGWQACCMHRANLRRLTRWAARINPPPQPASTDLACYWLVGLVDTSWPSTTMAASRPPSPVGPGHACQQRHAWSTYCCWLVRLDVMPSDGVVGCSML
jgi:hypothetical protein